MVERTNHDYRDVAKEIQQARNGAASDEPDPVTETHSKAKAHDLTAHNRVLSEDSDGTLGSVIGSGTIPTENKITCDVKVYMLGFSRIRRVKEKGLLTKN